jgi:hypothetical protein
MTLSWLPIASLSTYNRAKSFIFKAERASFTRGPRAPDLQTVSTLHLPSPAIGTGKPKESYGIGLGGDCGLSWGTPIFNSRVSHGIAVPCMTTDVSAMKNTK